MKPIKQERLMFRVPNTEEGRADLDRIKKSLNKNSYFLRTKFTGPRPKGTSGYNTSEANATSIRVYVESKRPEDNINPNVPKYISRAQYYEYIQRGRDIEKKQFEYHSKTLIDSEKTAKYWEYQYKALKNRLSSVLFNQFIKETNNDGQII